MKLSAPIFRLKRQAKQQAREKDIPLNQALDAIARAEGFQRWSQLASVWADRTPAAALLDQLVPGDLLLLGARPRQGKTLLALDLLREAAAAGRPGFFFTLEYTDADIAERLALLGAAPGGGFVADTSDAISADHVIARMKDAGPGAVAVIDYLQLLDQRRAHPALEEQVRALKAFAAESGAILVLIAQIDRRFEAAEKALPDLADVRLPNPLDLALFSRCCFLHEGEIRFGKVA